MISVGAIFLYWVAATIILVQLGQLSCFSMFIKPRSGRTVNKIALKAAKNEIGKPVNFIEEKNIEQSLFNPPPRSKKMMNQRGIITEVEDVIVNLAPAIKPNGTRPADGEPPVFVDQASIDEKALRATPIGKLLFGILDKVFPVFREPNWFDVYDPPLSSEQNLELPYFDGFDFVNSSWTVYIRHRYGVWNWLDRIGVVPPVTTRVFIRGDGVTMWSDGFYGDWYINPAINYIQIEKHFGRGYGYTQYSRGIRIFQVQKWNFEHEVGRYWNRGLRSYLRNETNYWALEGRVWGTAVKWRPYPRDQGKFIAIRDGTNLTEIFGEGETPWEKRFKHSMSLPFYQAHPDQLERIEDNFDYFYRNLLGRKIR